MKNTSPTTTHSIIFGNSNPVIRDNEIIKIVTEFIGHLQLNNVTNQRIPNVSDTLLFKSGAMYIYLISNAFMKRTTLSPSKEILDPLKHLFLSKSPYEITMTLVQMLKSKKLHDFNEILKKLLEKNMDLLDFQYLSIDGDTLMENNVYQKTKINRKGN